jgi:hypothetical protein
VTAPLLTLNTSLQLSVAPNVRTIREFQAEVSQADMAQRARTTSMKAEAPVRFSAMFGMKNKQNVLKAN